MKCRNGLIPVATFFLRRFLLKNSVRNDKLMSHSFPIFVRLQDSCFHFDSNFLYSKRKLCEKLLKELFSENNSSLEQNLLNEKSFNEAIYMKPNSHNMKSIFKLVPVFCLLLFVMSSCKSQKAVVDANQEPEEVIEETTPEPTPPVKEEPKVDPEAANRALDARLSNYFGQIANASSINAANNNIREAVGMFSNGEAPVLIIFYAANGTEDFDEPTTITKYLNYLKDLKKAPHKVKEMVMDPQGRIKELVLVKK